MSDPAADDSAHNRFDEKLGTRTHAHAGANAKGDEETAATIIDEAVNFGSGKAIIPMTVGIARGIRVEFGLYMCYTILNRSFVYA